MSKEFLELAQHNAAWDQSLTARLGFLDMAWVVIVVPWLGGRVAPVFRDLTAFSAVDRSAKRPNCCSSASARARWAVASRSARANAA